MNKQNKKSSEEIKAFRFKGLGGHQIIIDGKSYDVFFNDFNNYFYITTEIKLAEALRNRGFQEE